MSNPAQEEADRLFSQKEHHNSHPEDRDDSDSLSQHSSAPKEDYHSDQDGDKDTFHNQNTQMATTANCHIPKTRFDANTGPKGVIADAQSFTRAKQSTFRKTLNTFANAISSKPAQTPAAELRHSSGSEQDSDDEDFMRQWRQNRLQELIERNNASVRRKSPSRRTWGTVEDVDANGYLDAIEKVNDDVTVVVCIYDPESTTSSKVEDMLGTIAYKHSTTRFVKMHHEIAEMRERGRHFRDDIGCETGRPGDNIKEERSVEWIDRRRQHHIPTVTRVAAPCLPDTDEVKLRMGTTKKRREQEQNAPAFERVMLDHSETTPLGDDIEMSEVYTGEGLEHLRNMARQEESLSSEVFR